MSFDIFFGLAFIVCLAGLLYRFFIWFSQSIDPSRENVPIGKRFTHSLSAVISTLFSVKLLKIIQSIFVDMIFQKRIFDKSLFRWFTHALIFISFLVLFFTHAIGSFSYDLIGREYISTLNPALTMRNVFGLLALIGVCLAIYRRIRLSSNRLKSYLSDWAALAIIATIMVSGFFLEGAKISSYTVYQEMVEEYGEYDGEEGEALEAFWVAEYGLHSPNFNGGIDSELVEMGRELNMDGSCIECHAANSNAFVSFSLAGFIGPISAALGDNGTRGFLLFIHLGACIALLAWLPFSKMFHIASAPLNLIISRAKGDKTEIAPQSVSGLTSQMVGLSACTHCGSCTVECSSMMFYESFQNDFILPSEKVQFLKKIAAGKEVDDATLKRLQKGLYVCTSCDRCTDICPSGINLRELFVNSRYFLLEKGVLETSMLSHFSFPLSLAKQFAENHLKALKKVHEEFKSKFTSLPSFMGPLKLSKSTLLDNTSYNSCYSCQRCTNICPVVRNYDNPAEALDMTPHQIIFSLGTGNIDLAIGSKMIWSCSTCYLCQEHCPNKVELTDIFYRLKNIAINKIEAGDNS